MKVYSTIILALPMLMGGFVQFVLSQYYQKYATDALLLDSAIIGGIFFVSRFSDAILDPVCGYLSDRLKARRLLIALGLLAMTVGMLVAFLPAAFPGIAGHWNTGQAKRFEYLCAAGGIFTVYLGVTLVYIPHYAWLTELSRMNVKLPFFASRAVTENFGTILGGITLILLIPYQKTGGSALYTIIAVALLALLTFGFAPVVLYRSEGNNRSAHSFSEALRLIVRNKKFSIVAAMSFFNQFAATTLLAVSLYYTDNVLRNKELGAQMPVIFLLSATASVPLWSYLTRRVDSLRLWRMALIVIVAMFPLLVFGDYILIVVGGIGIAAGAVILFVPQEVSRIAQENEGVYFAAFTFVNKSAMAAAPLLIGVALSAAGYKPDISSETVSATITGLFIGAPLLAFAFSLALLTRYAKNESINRR